MEYSELGSHTLRPTRFSTAPCQSLSYSSRDISHFCLFFFSPFCKWEKYWLWRSCPHMTFKIFLLKLCCRNRHIKKISAQLWGALKNQEYKLSTSAERKKLNVTLQKIQHFYWLISLSIIASHRIHPDIHTVAHSIHQMLFKIMCAHSSSSSWSKQSDEILNS